MRIGRTLALALGVAVCAGLAAVLPISPLAAFGIGAVGAFIVAWAVGAPAEAVIGDIGAGHTAEVTVSSPDREGLAARALVESLPSPILIITRTGRVSYANKAAQEELPRLEPGLHFASLIRAPAFVEAVQATMADSVERRIQFTSNQGRDRFFEARVGLLPADAAFGPEPQIIVQIEDRTEARRAESLRSDFIANASHELRTPLASIIGYIETLQHHAKNDPEAREKFLGIMGREAARMQRLVDDLMSLSRIELNEHVRPVEEWSLNAIAAESASALAPLAERQGVALEIDLEPVGAMVRGDRDQLAQVFANLIDNAMKYAGPGRTVRLVVAAPDRGNANRHGVSVIDDGPGIAREHVHRLTERFYRVSVNSSRNKGGTGLGLAIVKHILNRHEGRLEIASTLGKGSAFTVWLPASEAAPDLPAAPGVDADERDRRTA